MQVSRRSRCVQDALRRSQDGEPLGRLYDRCWDVEHEHRAFWKRRAARAEQTLRSMLASDALTLEQRAEILTVVYGSRGAVRDLKTLSKLEAEVVTLFRQADAAIRQSVRNILRAAVEGHRLAAGARR